MITREDILVELREVREDHRAFVIAKDAIHSRIMEQEGRPRQDLLESWAGTQASINSLVMAISGCQRLIDTYTDELEKLEAPDNVVSLVKGTDDV